MRGGDDSSVCMGIENGPTPAKTPWGGAAKNFSGTYDNAICLCSTVNSLVVGYLVQPLHVFKVSHRSFVLHEPTVAPRPGRQHKAIAPPVSGRACSQPG